VRPGRKRTSLRPPALSSPEAGGSNFLEYVSKFIPHYTTSYRGRRHRTYSVARPSFPGTVTLVRDDDYGDQDYDGDDNDLRYFNPLAYTAGCETG
jgi:hypothetical protein